MAVHQIRINRLGENVCRVLLPRPLQKREAPRPDPLLRPQLGDGEAPDATDPNAPANSERRAAVGADLKRDSESEVLGDGRKAKALCCSSNNAGQLSLPRAQSDGLLGRRPMLNGMCGADAHPSTRGTPGV
eukprot:15474059-Alexandrium_andersonii.AAC.1